MKQYQGSEPIGLYTVGVLNTLVANGYDKSFEFEQWTGQVDSKGVEIYEGDIVEWERKWSPYSYGGEYDIELMRAPVAFLDGGFCFAWGHENCNKEDPTIPCIVIGNIHENPELLKS